MKEYLGIDIGGTNVKMGVVDEEGRIHDFYSYPTIDWRQSGQFVEKLIEAIRFRLTGHKEVRHVGIGVPGTLTKDRKTPLEVPAIADINGVPLVGHIVQALPGFAVAMENDAHAAALGELYFSEQPPGDNFLFITLGTGIGSAAVIDRQLFLGGGGNAMELGHIVSRFERRLESNIGKRGMLAMAEAMLTDYRQPTMLPRDETLSGTKLILAAEGGDKLALRVFREVGHLLGEGLVAAIRLLDIKTVLVGGGLSAAFSYIEEGVHATLHQYLTPYYLDELTVRKATLGNDAGILGAASLCFIERS